MKFRTLKRRMFVTCNFVVEINMIAKSLNHKSKVNKVLRASLIITLLTIAGLVQIAMNPLIDINPLIGGHENLNYFQKSPNNFSFLLVGRKIEIDKFQKNLVLLLQFKYIAKTTFIHKNNLKKSKM